MFIQDANSSTNIYNLTKEDPGSKETFYHMARIDSIQHPRNGDTPSSGNESCSSSWIEVQSIPNDICGTLIDVVAAGGGFCGPNGHCRTPVNSNGPAFCSCPDGFSPLDQSKKVVGCKPDFLLPSCQNGNQKTDHVRFKRVLNVEWPFSDYVLCTQLCLDDCLCVVVIYEGNENACWKKKFPLSNGRYRESNTSIVLIKENIGSDKKDQSMVVVLALLLGSSVFLNILFFIASIVAFVLYRKRLNSRWNIDSTLATNKPERLVIVAIWCIQEDPLLRPSMKKVTQMLEGVIEVCVPPSPSLFTSSPPSLKN
ncbi:g-type lectin s-receptor-like serine/threonine-protein kinase lecrk4 [Quercus suber]|uniref:G-type lectin s-receptor-like serine/threonine-protein kinase lecrk4 n=1 Tax=Quercus suber TaxID=58331 RepID=A0AAW0LRV8_QUESU